MKLDELKWDAQGLVTVVVQDRLTGVIRMIAHANREAIEQTLASGQAYFYSRSRAALWRKGETSGNTIGVAAVWADCDGDALVYLAEPLGPSCHTGQETCFFQRLDPEAGQRAGGERAIEGAENRAPLDASGTASGPASGASLAKPLLPALWDALLARRAADGDTSYTRSLLDRGPEKIGAKVREEAGELDAALREESQERVVSEAADVLYHVLVGLLARDVGPRDVEAELARRFGVSGLVEKASRRG